MLIYNKETNGSEIISGLSLLHYTVLMMAIEPEMHETAVGVFPASIV